VKTQHKQRKAAVQPFKDRVHLWAEKVRVKPGQVRVQKMTRKWASCSPQSWVTFAEDLLHEPAKFQDYVIVHELLHLKVRNHGKLFKSLLSAHLPGWKQFLLSCQSRNRHGAEQ
jgi:predicted metal-dependent hydrolase